MNDLCNRKNVTVLSSRKLNGTVTNLAESASTVGLFNFVVVRKNEIDLKISVGRILAVCVWVNEVAFNLHSFYIQDSSIIID